MLLYKECEELKAAVDSSPAGHTPGVERSESMEAIQEHKVWGAQGSTGKSKAQVEETEGNSSLQVLPKLLEKPVKTKVTKGQIWRSFGHTLSFWVTHGLNDAQEGFSPVPPISSGA